LFQLVVSSWRKIVNGEGKPFIERKAKDKTLTPIGRSLNDLSFLSPAHPPTLITKFFNNHISDMKNNLTS